MAIKYGKFITINGIEFPYPKKSGIILQNFTLVDSSRNALGTVIGEKVGRTQYKIDGLEWAILPADVWSMMCKEFDKFTGTVTFPDMVNNQMRTLTMYFGDRSAEVWEISVATGMPTMYINCKCNIIDVGVQSE